MQTGLSFCSEEDITRTETVAITEMAASTLALQGRIGTMVPAELSSKQALSSASALRVVRAASVQRSASVVCASANKEEGTSCNRRDVFRIAGLAAAAALVLESKPAQAAFGEKANIFGSTPAKQLGYLTLKGEGFQVDVPSTWNPSKEEDFDNVALRWEDNADATSHMVVLKEPAGGKSNISDFGSPEKFIGDMAFLLGEQVWIAENTRSEGGFEKDRVSAANLLNAEEVTQNGKKYYKYEVLTRTADGTMGGRHQLIAATVNGGDLYVCKVSVGDKRWFRGGVAKQARNTFNSFSVA